MKVKLSAATALGLVMAAGMGSAFAAAPDWSKVPAKKIPVFYPGQASYEWVMTKADHSTANQIKDKNRGCTYCHDEDATDVGKKIVEGKPAGNEKKPVEPTPIKGKPGFINVDVKTAHDGSKLYLRFEWEATKSAGGKKMDPKNDVKVAVMLDAGGVDGAKLNGCWSTCHNDLRSMPDADDKAKGHAKAKALGWEDGVTKYIAESRTSLEMTKKPRGGWDKLKSDADIDAALKAGKFYDLMQYRVGEKKAVDGYILDGRHMGGGKSLVKAEGKKEGNKYVVTFERTLAAGGKGDHKLEVGKNYNIGFAIHDDYTNARYHHVSLGYTMALDAKGVTIKEVGK
jgi:cytochrome c-type protein NapC